MPVATSRTSASTPTSFADLPSLSEQVERLITLGVHELAGMRAGELRALVPSGAAGPNRARNRDDARGDQGHDARGDQGRDARGEQGHDARGDQGHDARGDQGHDARGDHAPGERGEHTCVDEDVARPQADRGPGRLLVLAETLVPPSSLAPLLRLGEQSGFVVEDMTDVDTFRPIEAVAVPDSPAYVLADVERGDEMANWSPDEALPAILGAGRTPLTVTEGIYWALQTPGVIERNHCFMTIGSRLRKPTGRLDARTPAIWISNGTGRDGRARRHAPKVGWCWAGNRHTWLGFASAATRLPL